MKIQVVFTLCLLSIPSWVLAQHLGDTYTNVVFEDGAKVRSEPSMNGSVLGNLSHNQHFRFCWQGLNHPDTIGGKPGYWRQIKWGDSMGFVWNGLIANGVLASKTTQPDTFLLRYNSSGYLEFKLFRDGQFSSSFFFNLEAPGQLWGHVSLGKTWNSQGKEIIALVFDKGEYKLFEWDGRRLQLSNIQLSDESQLNGRYAPFDGAIINTSGVNIRSGPSDTSTVYGTLPKYSRLPIVSVYHTYDRDLRRHWHCVKWKDTVAFILADYLDVAYKCINSNQLEGQRFLATSNALYVFEGDKIIDREPGWFDSDDKLIDFGNRGFGEGVQFIAKCYSANSCGQAGGDAYYLWDGKELKYFGDDYSVGDGGYSDGHDLIFPDEKDGVAKHVILHKWDSEGSNEQVIGCQDPHSDMLSSNFYVMKYEEDTLVEVPSKHSKLRETLSTEFPGHSLMHYMFCDLNDDGYDDVLFFMADRKYYEHDRERERAVLGYTLGNSTMGFESITFSDRLVQDGYNLVSFSNYGNEVTITIRYHVCMYSGNAQEAAKTELVYTYDKNAQKLVWKSRSQAENVESENERSIVWGNYQNQYFKTNTIYFEDSW